MTVINQENVVPPPSYNNIEGGSSRGNEDVTLPSYEEAVNPDGNF